MKEETIIKFLNNRCSSAEVEEVIDWARSKAWEPEGLNWGYNEWKSYRETDIPGEDEKFSKLFDQIQKRIEIESRKHSALKKKSSVIHLWTTWLTRTAAILLLPVLVFLFYTLSKMKTESAGYANLGVDSLEIIAPVGSQSVVQLPDGTEVYLNFGSKIKYPLIFTGQTREVELTGEAYFSVAQNLAKPFIVTTGNMKVKALGTVFNVLAYPDNDIVETTLISGKVVLVQNDASGQCNTIKTLTPGQHVVCNTKTGSFSCSTRNIEKYVAWKDGKLVFEDAPIAQVAEKLCRMFNVEIEIANDIKDYIYTVTFIDEPLFQILDLMAIATPVAYKTLPRKKMPDGTFSKQKIKLEKRN